MPGFDEREVTKQNIDNTLDLIYELGDADETTEKHLGHCLAAIASGQSHSNVVAYETPWNCHGSNKGTGWTESQAEDPDLTRRRSSMRKYWQIIEEEYQKIGQKDFQDIINELQEPYFSDCLVYYSPVTPTQQFQSTNDHGMLSPQPQISQEASSSSPIINVNSHSVFALSAHI